MIKKTNNGVVATFGTGDIGMNGGIDYKNYKALFVLYQADKGEIGRAEPSKFNNTDEFYKEHIVLEFTKIESIDVVIKNLTELREELKDTKFKLKREDRF